ncbi:MAG: restriction endonuclease subunit S [Oscillospiraceae bacterium]|nr:restriction endonuclease subunit S [Oscillospiraceae bacterium]
MEWKMVRLKDLGDIITGNTPPTKEKSYYDSKDVMFIKPDDLVENKVNLIDTSNIYISKEATQKSRFVPKETLLVSCIGTIGKVAILKEDACFNQQINAIICDNKIINNLYLAFYFLKANNYLKKIANAAVVPIINKTNFGNIEIPTPPLHIQEKIAAILNKASSIIDKRKKQIQELNELSQCIFIKMFGDPVKNPLGWECKKLNTVICKIEAGWSCEGDQRQRKPDELSILKISSVTKGYFDENEYKVLKNNQEIKKYLTPNKGDLLFSRANTKELLGATCIVPKDYPFFLLPDKLWKISANFFINNITLKYMLSQDSIRNQISDLSTGTSGSMYNISMDKLKEITITVPPNAIQLTFASIIEKIENYQSHLSSSLLELEEYYKSLMQKAFSNELRFA